MRVSETDQLTEPPPPDKLYKHYETLLQKNLSATRNLPTVDYNRNASANDLNKEITIDEVKKCLMKMKNRKSPGHDNISSEMLKNLNEHLLMSVCKLFNKL